MQKVLQGLKIIEKYEPESDFRAEHDEIYCGGTPPDKMSHQDTQKMNALNWHWNELEECWGKFT